MNKFKTESEMLLVWSECKSNKQTEIEKILIKLNQIRKWNEQGKRENLLKMPFQSAHINNKWVTQMQQRFANKQIVRTDNSQELKKSRAKSRTW